MKTKPTRKKPVTLPESVPVLTDTKEPPMDPASGDKTPAWVEWLRDTAPAAFAARYKDRTTHLGKM